MDLMKWDQEHGTIKVTLNNPSTNNAGAYTISTNPGENDGEVTIRDDVIPVISISNAAETLAGQQATFTLTSDIEIWQPINIKFIPNSHLGRRFFKYNGC